MFTAFGTSCHSWATSIEELLYFSWQTGCLHLPNLGHCLLLVNLIATSFLPKSQNLSVVWMILFDLECFQTPLSMFWAVDSLLVQSQLFKGLNHLWLSLTFCLVALFYPYLALPFLARCYDLFSRALSISSYALQPLSLKLSLLLWRILFVIYNY